MKKMLAAFLFFLFCMSGLLYSSNKSGYQVIDLYICERSITLAELFAKASVNRKDLYITSYCTCEGVNNDLKSEVKIGNCDPPRDMVYSCICIGKSTY